MEHRTVMGQHFSFNIVEQSASLNGLNQSLVNIIGMFRCVSFIESCYASSAICCILQSIGVVLKGYGTFQNG